MFSLYLLLITSLLCLSASSPSPLPCPQLCLLALPSHYIPLPHTMVSINLLTSIFYVMFSDIFGSLWTVLRTAYFPRSGVLLPVLSEAVTQNEAYHDLVIGGAALPVEPRPIEAYNTILPISCSSFPVRCCVSAKVCSFYLHSFYLFLLFLASAVYL